MHVFFIGPDGGVSQRAVPDDYASQEGEALFPPHSAPARAEIVAALPAAAEAFELADRTAHNSPILAELATLDAVSPRAEERLIAAGLLNPTDLPGPVQHALDRKAELRLALW